MLDAQLQDEADVLGRVIAIDTLSKRRDKDAVAKLKQALNNDKFYGVRVDAARALRTIHSDDARDALLASTKQTDARVRRQVLEGITAFYHESAFKAQTAVLREEKNPDIQALTIGQLGRIPNQKCARHCCVN
jgi:aminopeptidase N